MRGKVRVNCVCPLEGLTDAQIGGRAVFLGVPVRVSLEEISI